MHHTHIIAAAVLASAGFTFAQDDKKTKPVPPPAPEAPAAAAPAATPENVSYAYGTMIARNLKQMGIKIDVAQLAKGISDTLDGKEPRHGGGHSVLTAVSVPSQHYLGSAMVDIKTNEIPVARELFERLDLDGRVVSLDALHTQDQTARELVLEHGADYLFTVKDNQPTLRANIQKLIPAPPADFSPSAQDGKPGGHA